MLRCKPVGVRECIEVGHQVDIERYLTVLQEKHGARANPDQEGSYLIGEPERPFYAPEQFEGHTFISGFNYRPLSDELVIALIQHPELAPETTMIRWTQEQDLILRNTLGELRRRLGGEREKMGKERVEFGG